MAVLIRGYKKFCITPRITKQIAIRGYGLKLGCAFISPITIIILIGYG